MLIPHRTTQTNNGGHVRLKLYLPEDTSPSPSNVLPAKTPLTEDHANDESDLLDENNFYNSLNKFFCTVKTLSRMALFYNVIQLILVVTIPHLLLAALCFGCTVVSKQQARHNRLPVLPIVIYSLMTCILFSVTLYELWPVTVTKPEQLYSFSELACAPTRSCIHFFQHTTPTNQRIQLGWSIIDMINFTRKTSLLIILIHLKVFAFIFMSISSILLLFLLAEERFGHEIVKKLGSNRYKIARVVFYVALTVVWLLYICYPLVFY
ncbi:unnamed protein product [Bursaphelenchus okinawaensis]|uniref:Uncharacterized protein n=1 Tax=Bursaphelenchus okinawaensis TaxID=465554 RepID=A0A811LK01_9BILA|nr:unnamed protein product [Bursaphelenchus okinawaensis]CAG9127326.1 unnamed protein product [Bursaphelenchus okinawaensis]